MVKEMGRGGFKVYTFINPLKGEGYMCSVTDS